MKVFPLSALAALLLLAGGALGADDYGMRQYVLVILKTGPTPMPAEYHKYYGSAALMLVNDAHAKVARKGF